MKYTCGIQYIQCGGRHQGVSELRLEGQVVEHILRGNEDHYECISEEDPGIGERKEMKKRRIHLLEEDGMFGMNMNSEMLPR